MRSIQAPASSDLDSSSPPGEEKQTLQNFIRALPIFIALAFRRCWNHCVEFEKGTHMKRQRQIILWSSVALSVLLAGITFARADGQLGRRWCAHHGAYGYLAHELNLNDTQRSQIKSIWEGEKPNVLALVRELSAENKEMDAASAQGNFDAGKIQPIADRQAATIAKLLVEKEKLRAQIYSTVLTPDQRSKADKLQERWHSRLDRIVTHLESGSGPLSKD
jgi:Spy/CpxP family protein refolding chaperone